MSDPDQVRRARAFESEPVTRSPVDVLIRRTDPDVPIPAYGHPGDAGADLSDHRGRRTRPRRERVVLPTGVSIALPDGYAAFVHPRSGLAARCGVALVNAPGTVDAGYRGEIKVIVVNLDPRESVRFERFDRIAQLVVQQVEKVRFHEVAELPGSARAEGGFRVHRRPRVGGRRRGPDHPRWEQLRFGRIRPGRTVTCSDVARRVVPPRTRRTRCARPSRSPTSQAHPTRPATGTRRMNLPPAPGRTDPGTAPRSPSPARAGSTWAASSSPGSRAWNCASRWPGDAIVAATVVLRDSAIQLRPSPPPRRRASGARSARRSPRASPSRAASSTRSRARWAGSCARRSPRTAPGRHGRGAARALRRRRRPPLVPARSHLRPGRRPAGGRGTAGDDLPGHRGRPRRRPDGPRDPIVLKLPDDAQMVPEGVQQEDQESSRFSGGMGQLSAAPRSPRSLADTARHRPVGRTLPGVRPTGFPGCGPPAFVRTGGHCPAVCRTHILGGRRSGPRTTEQHDREHQRGRSGTASPRTRPAAPWSRSRTCTGRTAAERRPYTPCAASPRDPARRTGRAQGPLRLPARPPCSAWSADWTPRQRPDHRRRHRTGRPRREGPAGAAPGPGRLHLPVLRPHPDPDRRRERRRTAAGCARPTRPSVTSGSPCCSPWSASPTTPSSAPASSPAASSSASPSPAPSPTAPPS